MATQFPLGLAWAALADRRRRTKNRRAMTDREFERVQRRRREEEARMAREAEIATCECGAQVRRNGRGEWVHVGKCEIED